jgi:hypothetical protein
MEHLEIITPIITAVITAITTLLAVWYRNYLLRKEKDKKCTIIDALNKDKELLENLEEIRVGNSADRLTIFQFHNGGDFYTGKSMQKLSLTYETADKGIQRIMPNRQNIPVSACNSSLKPLLENWNTKYFDVEKDFPESLCKLYQLDAGNKSTYQWALFDLDGRAIGIFTLDYVKRRKNLTEEQLEKLKLNIVKIPGYL